MPQFSSYPVTTTLGTGDKVLIHQSGTEKLLTGANLAVSLLNMSTTTTYSVDTIAALKGLDVSAAKTGNLASVGGYTTLLDGGGGDFYYDSTSVEFDNGGTIIAPNVGVGRWKRPASKIINVRWFGAKGDDSTNDTTAIQNATNLAKTFTTGTVYFPAGIYRIALAILSPNSPASSIAFVGDGPNVSVLKQTTAGAGAINAQSLNDSSIFQNNRVTITGLGFTTSAAGGTAIVISFGNPATTAGHYSQAVVIDNVSIKSDGALGNWSNGIDITSGWSCQISNVFISGNPVANVWTNLTGDGIRMRRYCVNSQFSNVQVGFMENFFHWTAEGTTATDGNTEGLLFTNCCATATRRGVYIEGNGNATVPRVSGLVWTGGMLDLRGPIAGFDLVRVEDFHISNVMIVEDGASGTNYGIRCNTCADGMVSNVDFFVFDFGLWTTGTCSAITIANCVFRGGVTQVAWNSGATNCKSGQGFVVKDATILETNAGGATNRIYFNQGYSIRVARTSNQSIASTVEDPITWQTVNYQDVTMWVAGSPARITPPPGVSRVRLTAGIRWNPDATGTYRVAKIKANNPAGFYQLNSTFAASQQFPDGSSGAAGSCTLCTGIIEVKDIVYFELTGQQNTAGALEVRFGEGTYLHMEIIG